MITAIAIDDEPLALEIIQVYSEELKSIMTLAHTFTNLDNAKRYINKFDVDVIFLDIEMPKANGIDFYNALKKTVKVIFTTAHSKYAVEGFKINASDYLLKPISQERFNQAVHRVVKQVELENSSSKENTHLAIRANYKLYNINLGTITYIEAMDDYIKIHMEDDRPVVARSTMKSVLKKLPSSKFVRIHKSYIVPIDRIKTVENQSVVIENNTFPIGSTYKKNIEKFL